MPTTSPPPGPPAGAVNWPQVPDCHGWLSLDARGQWRLQGEAVRHPGLQAFLNAHYGCDDEGCWRVQNGPQRVVVSFDEAPWVLNLSPHGLIATHTGLAVNVLHRLWFDEQGRLWLQCEHGLGRLDDRDLATFVEGCTDATGMPLPAAAWEAWLAKPVDGATATAVDVPFWQGQPIGHLPAAELRRRALSPGPPDTTINGSAAVAPEAG